MKSILIIDDEPRIREGLATTIHWSAYGVSEVHIAQNGGQALELLKKRRISLAITDIRMPGISGIDFIRRARELDAGMKFLIISGHADFEYAKEALQLQVIDYLLKPVNISELVQRVDRALRTQPDLPEPEARPAEPQAKAETPPRAKAYSPLVEKCVEYVRQNYTGDITLTALGERFERNPSYISHVFHAETGKTLTEFVNEVRVARALELMTNARLFLYEIAAMVGFNDYRYFISVFKKVTGKNPTMYTKNKDKDRGNRHAFGRTEPGDAQAVGGVRHPGVSPDGL